jgi:hypothetical protein
VLERVRQRLLHDAVDRQLDRRRQAFAGAVDAEIHRQPRCPHARHQDVQLCNARLWCTLGAFTVLAQHSEQAAHLHERLATAVLDLLEGRGARTGGTRPGRLQYDDAQVVRDDVVQLARHARPFLGHSELRVALERRRTSGEARALAARVDEHACEPQRECCDTEERRSPGVAGAAVLHVRILERSCLA